MCEMIQLICTFELYNLLYHQIPYGVILWNQWKVYNWGPFSTDTSYSIPSDKYIFVFVYHDHLTKCVVLGLLESERREIVSQNVDIFLLFESACFLRSDNSRCCIIEDSSFGGLVVSMLASSTQDRGFAPGRSHQIFWAKKFLSIPSFGRELKPFACLRHVKEPYNLRWKSQIVG
jgi:hypothetical protein